MTESKKRCKNRKHKILTENINDWRYIHVLMIAKLYTEENPKNDVSVAFELALSVVVTPAFGSIVVVGNTTLCAQLFCPAAPPVMSTPKGKHIPAIIPKRIPIPSQ